MSAQNDFAGVAPMESSTPRHILRLTGQENGDILISRHVAIRHLLDSPLLRTSGNSYFLSKVIDTLQSLQ